MSIEQDIRFAPIVSNTSEWLIWRDKAADELAAKDAQIAALTAEAATLRADNGRLRAQMLEMAERSAAKGQS